MSISKLLTLSRSDIENATPDKLRSLVLEFLALLRLNEEEIATLQETLTLMRGEERRRAEDIFIIPVEWSFTKTEQIIFTKLAANVGFVVTKKAIYDEVYSNLYTNKDVDIKILDVYVCKIRSKLEKCTTDIVVETVWGVGYVIPVRCKPSLLAYNRQRFMLSTQQTIAKLQEHFSDIANIVPLETELFASEVENVES